MPEIPQQQDPMQAVAFARITATELGKDARLESESCLSNSANLTVLADTLNKLCEVFAGAIPLVLDATMLANVHRALTSISEGTRAVGVGVQHAGERFAAHAEGWERESTVWQAIMERGTEKVT